MGVRDISRRTGVPEEVVRLVLRTLKRVVRKYAVEKQPLPERTSHTRKH